MATSGENNLVTEINASCDADVWRADDWRACGWEGTAEINADRVASGGLWKCPDCGAFNEVELVTGTPC